MKDMIVLKIWSNSYMDKEAELYKWLLKLDKDTYELGYTTIRFTYEEDAIAFRLRFGVYK
jgi:hypothetical protein